MSKHPVKDPVDESPPTKRTRFDKDPTLTLVTLPNEIKEEIFRNLAPNDLLNLMQACSTFNSYVEDNKSLMEKFTVRATQLLSSGVSSHRNYSRIFVDCDLSEEVIEAVKKSFINIEQCVKVIIFDKRIGYIRIRFYLLSQAAFENQARICKLAEKFVAICSSYVTINYVEGDMIEDQHKNETKLKTFNAFREATSFLPEYHYMDEINFYEGCFFLNNEENSFINCEGNSKLKRINFFKSLESSRQHMKFGPNYRPCTYRGSNLSDYQSTVEEITIQNYAINKTLCFDFPKLKTVRFINCRLEHEKVFGYKFNSTSNLLVTSVVIEELHIENCEKLLWGHLEEHKGSKVKHLKLVNMKYPRSYMKLIEIARKNVEKLTMINVTFEGDEETSEDEEESSEVEEEESSEED